MAKVCKYQYLRTSFIFLVGFMPWPLRMVISPPWQSGLNKIRKAAIVLCFAFLDEQKHKPRL